MSRIIATPELQTRMSSLGLIPYPPPIAESQRYIKSEIDKWGGLVKSLGLAGTI
jgi:tripartite-type tricarboxylate transporter receptor subunit TctC